MFALNIGECVRSEYWEDKFCFSEISHEYEFKSLSKESRCSYENNLKGIRRRNLRSIVIGHIHIN